VKHLVNELGLVSASKYTAFEKFLEEHGQRSFGVSRFHGANVEQRTGMTESGGISICMYLVKLGESWSKSSADTHLQPFSVGDEKLSKVSFDPRFEERHGRRHAPQPRVRTPRPE